MQVHGELRVVLAGKGVKLAGAGHHLQHVGEVGHGADRFAERLDGLHELGVFDLVERAAAVGQLHAGLHLAVVAAGLRRLPLAAVGVQPFDQERLAAGTACGRKVGISSISPLTGASTLSTTIASINASMRAGRAL